jgi:hypothetical protein
MKYLRKFNEQEKSIEEWCNEFGLYNFEIINNAIVDVRSNVNIQSNELYQIPIQFGIVTGTFNCIYNFLTTLEGSPNNVGLSFKCNNNLLNTLEGGVKTLGGNFDCSNNKLTSLKGCPKEIPGVFWCVDNLLISLEGGPDKTSHEFYCSGNPIYPVYKLFGYEKYKASIEDYNYLRDGMKIYRIRFERACENAGIIMPESIPGYEYI